MNEFIHELGEDYILDDYKVKKDIVVFHISSRCEELVCPYCGEKSNKVHSTYEREIQDLPMQNKKVILLVKTRKMFCGNSLCSKKTFSERHHFVDRKGKKPRRLEKNIIYSSTQLSSVNASKVLKTSNIDVCKSSICELLKKNAIHCG